MAGVDIDCPLFVDLDGTLIKTDLLHEGILKLVKISPLTIFLLPLWLLRGKAYLKYKIAQIAEPDFSLLPRNEDFIDFLKHQKQSGRSIYLATASNKKYAEKVAANFALFDGVIASDRETNLKGKVKAKQCQAIANEFSYAGNDVSDFEIFKLAKESYLINPSSKALKRSLTEPVKKIWQDSKPGPYIWVKALRLSQWLKNLLIFVPLFVSHAYINLENIVLALLGFIAFGLLASSTYIFNDLLDLDSDRTHPRKCKRPFACGELQIKVGAFAILILFLAALSLVHFTPRGFQLALACYLLITLSYSLLLKQYVIIDVLALASLYTIRIIAGTLLLGVELSFWLLAFSMFIFLSLALLKRCTEMKLLFESDIISTSGRDYYRDDYALIQTIGVASAFMAVLVLALFIQSTYEGDIYRSPMLLWPIFPAFIYWICRMWLKMNRNEMTDDPIVFSITDKGSRITVLFICIIVITAKML